MNQSLKQTIKFIVIALLSLTLSLSWSSKSLGQIPLLLDGGNEQSIQSRYSPWNLNQAYPCGKFLCSNIYLFDANVNQGFNPELTLSISKKLDESNVDVVNALETRSQLVQRVFKKIINY